MSLLRKILDFFIGIFVGESSEKDSQVKPKRKYTKDMYQFTEEEISYIKLAYRSHLVYNAKVDRVHRKTLADLTNELNAILGRHKSTRSYARIWGTQDAVELKAFEE